jgi:RNA polymerase sigma-70 factor, ECF subfamily
MTAKTDNFEQELALRFVQGDQDAFEKLVKIHKNALYGFLRRYLPSQDLVEDAFQDTFMQFYLSRENFDPSRAVRPWLFTIAANKARDTLRKRKRESTVSINKISDSADMSFDDTLNSIVSSDITPDKLALDDEKKALVRDIVENMPDNLKEIIILAYFKQFSYKQMADILSIPIGTVKSRLHSAVGYFVKKWKNTYMDKDSNE